ncbi:MAG: hypothetical protein HOM68_26350 [Gemmatimonadetes bacterium]|nr:hypothetical protein [Gemmatimonadota bacterium]MBT5060091.1 hypothetical protein [Gemmatimonadota bacterium]MBT5144242.1 hypothetical protein [Gemmatimonadota bacterium]MBT5588732.1 hypothetical protein [Gemmatimonadota bacterium]MBT5964550.1 hypothetical protein [Gemmatimonadota bacterium]
MPQIQILYWRNIPAQVRVFAERRPISAQLPERFQLHIDRVAMREGLAGTDEYLAQWQWSDKQECDGDPHEILRQTIDTLIREQDVREQDPDGNPADNPDASDNTPND